MLKFIIRRLIGLIPVILIISIILFGLVQLMPGDPVSAYLGIGSKVSPEQQEQIREKLGLDKPWYIQYVKWLKRTVIEGDLGTSIKYRKPVTELMGEYIWNTFIINFIATIIAFAIAIPVGIKSAVKKYSAFDNFFTVFSLVGVSMPSFFFALILIFFIAIPFPVIPLNGMRTSLMAAMGYPSKLAEIKDILLHMILPVTVLSLTSLAGLIKYVRNSVIDVINQDYIRTARSKGLKEKVVIYRHAFRNALIPLVTLAGLYIPSLFAGAMILETVFLWPGIGNILYTSILDRDYSVVIATNVFYALLMVLGNLLSDISYALVDPRVKVD